jgi:hypothetical protein
MKDEIASSPNTHKLILTHAVLTGLTPLIPIPLLDDLVKAYFLRRLVRRLGASHGFTLDPEDVKILADEPETGCLPGCLGRVLLYPVKKIFRKIFFFLEWKRATDLVSRTYHRGYLLDHAIREGWYGPGLGLQPAQAVRAAVDAVCVEVPTSPVTQAVRGVFGQSKAALKGAVSLLQGSLQRVTGSPDDARVAEAVEAVEAEEEAEIGGVIDRLQQAIERIPSSHFDRLRSLLAARLGKGGGRP